jgi:hypothetical protein
MTTRTLPVLAACALLAASPARAVDYAKIDRTIAKEPAYQSKAPKYALLLFGPEARLRVWAVLDGGTLYLDRDGDGDLTGKGERFDRLADCKDVALKDPDGKTRYIITAVGEFPQGDPPRPHLDVSVDIKGPVEYRQYCGTELRDSPKKAAVAHFHGPLAAGPRTINWKLPPRLALAAGDKPTDLPALVGTMSAEHGCWVVVRSDNGDKPAFPEGVRPLVDVEFPPKAAGGAPVKKRYRLDGFC